MQKGGSDDGSTYLVLRDGSERMIMPYSLGQSSKGAAGFGQMVVKVLADFGTIEDDATQVSKVFHCF